MTKLCYNCGAEIDEGTILDICPNCKILLNPNNLKWRRSLSLLFCLLCLIPILTTLVVVLMS